MMNFVIHRSVKKYRAINCQVLPEYRILIASASMI